MVDPRCLLNVKVHICDPHPIVRKGIRESLHETPDIKVSGEWNDIEQLAASRGECADVLIVGHESGLSQISEPIGANLPNRFRAVLLLSSERRDSEYAMRAMRLGVRGIFYRHHATELLVNSIRELHRGGLWFERSHTEDFVLSILEGQVQGPCDAADSGTMHFSLRQQRIIQLVQAGRSNKEIAQSIFVSQATVASELTTIYRALGVTDRMQLVLKTGTGAQSVAPAQRSLRAVGA